MNKVALYVVQLAPYFSHYIYINMRLYAENLNIYIIWDIDKA